MREGESEVFCASPPPHHSKGEMSLPKRGKFHAFNKVRIIMHCDFLIWHVQLFKEDMFKCMFSHCMSMSFAFFGVCKALKLLLHLEVSVAS